MSYHHLNTLTIFPERLDHNLRVLSRVHENISPVPVLKSNAYGHGIKLLAKHLMNYDVPFICVDSLFEAYELQKFGYRKDILIMGFVDPRDIPRERRFIYAASSIIYGLALLRNYSRVRLHLFLDTGMHREGGRFFSADIRKLTPHIEGIMSHLATPDDHESADLQMQSFRDQIQELGIQPTYIHILASGGLVHVPKIFPGAQNIARCGLAFYGYGHPDLLPALRVTTQLVQVKEIQAGGKVGYDGAFTAERTMKIGVLPIGYHDGVDRRLSGASFVQIRDTLCPIIGRVSMNITTIDCTHLEVQEGDEVVFIDENPTSEICLENQARCANMIPYDLLVHLNKEMYRKIG